MSNVSRYQNPEIFEQLAIEYAIGSLCGRSRERFKVIIDTHFYLRAVVDAYEKKFALLIELLPDEKPSKNVWENIEEHIKYSQVRNAQKDKILWWKTSFFKQGLGLAAMALIISTFLQLNPMTTTPVATAYSAVLRSDLNELIVFTKIKKSEMKLYIEIMEPVQVADDMELILWCEPKHGGMPMRMGTILKTGRTEMNISQNEWQNMKDVGVLTISIEQKGKNTIREPTGNIIVEGELIAVFK